MSWSNDGLVLYELASKGIMNSDYAETIGVVGHGKDLDNPASLRERVGDNPLRVKAAVRGSPSMVRRTEGRHFSACILVVSILTFWRRYPL